MYFFERWWIFLKEKAITRKREGGPRCALSNNSKRATTLMTPTTCYKPYIGSWCFKNDLAENSFFSLTNPLKNDTCLPSIKSLSSKKDLCHFPCHRIAPTDRAPLNYHGKSWDCLPPSRLLTGPYILSTLRWCFWKLKHIEPWENATTSQERTWLDHLYSQSLYYFLI